MEPDTLAPTRGWRNDQQGYGRLSQSLHWIVATVMITLVGLGMIAEGMPRGQATRDNVLFVHKSLGVLLLVLTLVRLSWFLRSPAPPPSDGLAIWESRLSWIVHKLLYLLMFAMPLSGILLSQAAGKEVPFFGLFSLPNLVPVDPSVPAPERPLLQLGVLLHTQVFKIALFAAFALHIGGALKHALVDRKPAMFRRMWGR